MLIQYEGQESLARPTLTDNEIINAVSQFFNLMTHSSAYGLMVYLMYHLTAICNADRLKPSHPYICPYMYVCNTDLICT